MCWRGGKRPLGMETSPLRCGRCLAKGLVSRYTSPIYSNAQLYGVRLRSVGSVVGKTRKLKEVSLMRKNRLIVMCVVLVCLILGFTYMVRSGIVDLSALTGTGKELTPEEKEELFEALITAYDGSKEKGNTQDVLAFYRGAIGRFPDERIIHANLGTLYLRIGDSKNAIRILKESLTKKDALYTGSATVLHKIYNNIGMGYLNLEDIETAKEWLEKAYEEQPTNVHTLYLLGQVYAQTGEYRKGYECFKVAFTRAPEYANETDLQYYNMCRVKTGIKIDGSTTVETE